jgi:cell division protein FtsI/penicillin-binding protein 2
MVALRIVATTLIIGSFLLSTSSGMIGRASACGVTPGNSSDREGALFAQSASQILNRDFPGDDISFLLLDARTGAAIASRWEQPETAIPLGSLVKPFIALAYGEQHAFNYPTHFCRGTVTGCWRPGGHGTVNLSAAMAFSCNSYFRLLTANMTAADVAPVADRFGLEPPSANIYGSALLGLGDVSPTQNAQELQVQKSVTPQSASQWLISPLSMARAYLQLARRRDDRGVSLILDGMALSAREGTSAAVDQSLRYPSALAKTGTAPCTHNKHAPGDGYTAVLTPSDHPQFLLLVRVHGVPGSQAAKTAGQMLRDIEP